MTASPPRPPGSARTWPAGSQRTRPPTRRRNTPPQPGGCWSRSVPTACSTGSSRCRRSARSCGSRRRRPSASTSSTTWCTDGMSHARSGWAGPAIGPSRICSIWMCSGRFCLSRNRYPTTNGGGSLPRRSRHGSRPHRTPTHLPHLARLTGSSRYSAGVRNGRPEGAGYRRRMGTERSDVVIIGAGLAGTAAAWALAGRGRSVAIVEAFPPGHRRGSSHGSARIFRRAYPDPLYVRLTGEAQRRWRQLSDEAAQELVLTTGALDFGPAREQEKMYDILTAFGVPAELIPAAAAAERWPGMSFGPDPVMFHPDGGVLDPERAMAAMRSIATARGAQFHDGTRVLRVEPREAGATVHTDDRTWHARVVIVAAGAWLEPLPGAHAGLPSLFVPQQDAFPFAPAEPGPWPAFIYHDEITRYGLRAGGGGEVAGGVRGGEHGHGTVTTADGRDGIVSPAARDRIRAFARRRLGGLDTLKAGEKSCLYTSTASEDFILDRQGPFVICSPCSGHGRLEER